MSIGIMNVNYHPNRMKGVAGSWFKGTRLFIPIFNVSTWCPGVVLFFLLFSCKSELPKVSSNTSDAIIVDELNPQSTVIADSILQEIDYVYLENTNDAIIGNISELLVTNDYLIILDIYNTSSILIFTRSGKFINKIHRPGKGPGEYLQPTDIAFDYSTGELLLLNEYPSKIIRYNLLGEIMEEIPLPIRFLSFTTLANGDIVLFNDAYIRNTGNPAGHLNDIFSRLLLVDGDKSYIELGGMVNRTYEVNEISSMNYGIMNNKDISFRPLFNDTIFELVGLEEKPILTINFGAHTINESDVSLLDSYDFLSVSARKDFYYLNGPHFQTPEFISSFIYSPAQRKSYFLLYNKGDQSHLVFHMLKNTPYSVCNLVPVTAYNEYFVSVIQIPQLLELKKNLKSKRNIPQEHLKFTPPPELLNLIDENSNPVLAFYKLRPDKINLETVQYE